MSHWGLNVECSMWNVFLSGLLLAPFSLPAQAPPQLPPGGLVQLQVAQPVVDVSVPATAMAVFDPPVVQPGEKTFYRVNVVATESSIRWPEKISAPPELQFGAPASGQMSQFLGNQYHPLTAFVYEVRATATGHFAVTNFTVTVYGQPVEIPAATLDVVAENASPNPPPQLMLETSATNVFLGQPFHVRVLLPSGAGNQVEVLQEVQLNSRSLMTDKMTQRQTIQTINLNGQLKPAFLCEMTVTPIATGPLKFSAQGFTAGHQFTGPITIRGQVTLSSGPPKYDLLVSDPVAINVRPLPAGGELPGFTGAIGDFFMDPPQLSTNRIRVGDPVHLKLVFHGKGDLTQLTPPAPPRSRDWEIIADNPPNTGFTFIPLTDEVNATPAIPFSYFDAATTQFVDLTIPPLPVTVVAQGLPTELPPMEDESPSAVPLKLSGLAPSPGKTASSLEPLQLRGWFVGLQLLPVGGFLALWQWDRRRRFLEAHPEIVCRRQARRALRRKKRELQNAASAGDPTAFVRHAADALRIACAPHFPAHPQALVCADVLAQLDDAEKKGRTGETVQKVFAADDAQFAAAPKTQPGLLALQSEVDAALLKLEEKL